MALCMEDKTASRMLNATCNPISINMEVRTRAKPQQGLLAPRSFRVGPVTEYSIIKDYALYTKQTSMTQWTSQWPG